MKKIIYKEHLIMLTCGYYFTLGKVFTTLKKAKAQIELL